MIFSPILIIKNLKVNLRRELKNNKERFDFYLFPFHGYSTSKHIKIIQNKNVATTVKLGNQINHVFDDVIIKPELLLEKLDFGNSILFGFYLMASTYNERGELCYTFCGSLNFDISSLYTSSYKLMYYSSEIIDYSLAEDIKKESNGIYSAKDCIIGHVEAKIISNKSIFQRMVRDLPTAREKFSLNGNNDHHDLSKILNRIESGLYNLEEINSFMGKFIVNYYYESCLTKSHENEVISDYENFNAELKKGYIKEPKLGFNILKNSDSYQVPNYIIPTGLKLPSFCYIMRSDSLTDPYFDGIEDLFLSHLESICLFYPEIDFSLHKVIENIRNMLSRKDIRINNLEENASVEVIMELCTKTSDEPYLSDKGISKNGNTYENDIYFSSAITYGTDCDDGAMNAYSIKKLISNNRRWKSKSMIVISDFYRQFVASMCIIICGITQSNNGGLEYIDRAHSKFSRRRDRPSNKFGVSDSDKKGACHVACVLFPVNFFNSVSGLSRKSDIENNHLIILETTARTNPSLSTYSTSDNMLKENRNKLSSLESKLRDAISRFRGSNIVDVKNSSLFSNSSWYNSVLDVWSNDYSDNQIKATNSIFTRTVRGEKYWGINVIELIDLINGKKDKVLSGESVKLDHRIQINAENYNRLNSIIKSRLGYYHIFEPVEFTSKDKIDYRLDRTTDIYEMIVEYLNNRSAEEKRIWIDFMDLYNKYKDGYVIQGLKGSSFIKNSHFVRLTTMVGIMNDRRKTPSNVIKSIIDQINFGIKKIERSGSYSSNSKQSKSFISIYPIISCPKKDRPFTKFSFLLNSDISSHNPEDTKVSYSSNIGQFGR